METLIKEEQWQLFVNRHALSTQQEEQFKEYMALLIEWNKSINLTAIEEPKKILNYHFQDSLALIHHTDLASYDTLIDIGAGAGFPGIPCAIKYPTIKTILIEVSQKKVRFLQTVIQTLGLTNIEIYSQDWRTFLRNSDYKKPLFVARASLAIDELLRIFKPQSAYKDALLVYWASDQWLPELSQEPFISAKIPYRVGSRNRALIFFKLPQY